MTLEVHVETAKESLDRLLERLGPGETITLLDAQGTPMAVLVAVKHVATLPPSVSDWEQRWDALAQEVSRAWKSDKGAVETLIEMRR